jgi:hypothetical protein
MAVHIDVQLPGARLGAADGEAGKGLLAGFSAMALGSLLKYTVLIPTAHQSLACMGLGMLATYSATTLLPIIQSGYQRTKRDFSDFINRKVTLSSIATSSVVGTVAGLATWVLNPTAAVITGLGSLFATAYYSSTDAVPPVAAGSLPRNFVTQQRAPFDVQLEGQFVAPNCPSVAAAFEAIKGRYAPEQYDGLMKIILVSMFSQDRNALIQLLNTQIDAHYTYPGVNLPNVLRSTQRHLYEELQQAAERRAGGEQEEAFVRRPQQQGRGRWQRGPQQRGRGHWHHAHQGGRNRFRR